MVATIKAAAIISGVTFLPPQRTRGLTCLNPILQHDNHVYIHRDFCSMHEIT